jgi:tetratricopeptide (TPR) repeat protein
VADAEASPAKARVLAQSVRFDMFATRYDPERVRAALDITEALGLDELRAHVLISAGTVRAGQGNDEGFAQLTAGLDAARAGNWLWAISRGATNRCSVLNFRGRAREALEANLEALHAVERLGSPSQWRHVRANMIEQWAESGDWELAIPAADEFLAECERIGVFYNAITVAFVRAMLRLGLGDLDGAVADQAFALGHARVAKDPQVLYYALAVAVHVRADTGQVEAAREYFDELLSLDPAAFRYIGLAVGDVTWAAPTIDRAKSAQHALAFADWPSFQAARALLDGDPVGAAAIYDAHGAARSAALARLRGGEPAELHRALEFFTRVGATRYARECERLLNAVL